MVAYVGSAILHFIPIALYVGSALLGLPYFRSDADEYQDHATVIPIEFDLDELEASKGATAPETTPAHAATLEEPPSPEAPVKPIASADTSKDAGPKDAASDAPVDAPEDHARDAVSDADGDGNLDAAPPAIASAEGGRDAKEVAVDAAIAVLPGGDSGAVALAGDAGAAGVGDGSADGADARPYEQIRDPIAVAGDARLVAQRNPNVSLILYTGRIRRHPLASKHASTLTSIPQWNDFFGGTGMDPVRDTEWLLLAGPQFRDTSRVSVVLRYTVSEAKMRAAVNVLAARSQPPGTWAERNGVRYVKIHADRADRYVVMPQPRVLVVVPLDGLEQAVGLRTARFPSGEGDGTAVLLDLKTPRNAFRGTPVDIPATIAWVKLAFKLMPDGGADVRIDAEDASETAARQDATMLSEQVEKAAVIRVLFVQQRLFDSVTFRAEGTHVRAETHFTQSQLNTILSMIGAEVDRVARERQGGAGRP